MVKLTELYEKIDKNGATYYVGDATLNTRFIIHKKKSTGAAKEPKFVLYVSEKQPRPPVSNDDESFGNK